MVPVLVGVEDVADSTVPEVGGEAVSDDRGVGGVHQHQ